MMDDGWLALVRIARDAGDVSSLFPPGIDSLYDAPFAFVLAIKKALEIIGYDELEESERPPKWIWLDSKRMERWWVEIKRLRAAKREGHGDLGAMPKNELVSDFLRQFRFNE